jgi:hypothetical protein
MYIKICKNIWTLCPLYREYIYFYKFLCTYGISLRASTIDGQDVEASSREDKSSLSKQSATVSVVSALKWLYALWVRAWSVAQKCCSGKTRICLEEWSFSDMHGLWNQPQFCLDRCSSHREESSLLHRWDFIVSCDVTDSFIFLPIGSLLCAALCTNTYFLVHRGTRRSSNGRLLLGAATYMLNRKLHYY